MSIRKCASCDEPASDNETICRRCTRQTRHHLADQAAHYEELVVALTRQVKMNAANDGGKSSPNLLWSGIGDMYVGRQQSGEWVTPDLLKRISASLPPARPAADAIHTQRNVLVSWTRLLVEEEIAPDYPADSIPALACFIESHLGRLRMHECVGELVDEMRKLARQIMVAIDTPENRTKVHVGPCPHEWVEELEGGGAEMVRCDGQVDAIFPRDTEQRPVIRCEMCRSEWTAERWEHVGKEIHKRKQVDALLDRVLNGGRSRWETVQDAARMLAVPEREIRRAVERRKIRALVVGGGKKRRWYLVDWTDASEWAQRAA